MSQLKEITANGKTYKYEGPFQPTRNNKKFSIIYHRDDGTEKIINYGAEGMSDFTQHKDEDRRRRFWSRFSGRKKKDGTRFIDDPESPLFWSARLLW